MPVMKTKDDRQPTLFDWKPPVKILAFPQARRVGPMRKTALNLLKLDGEEKKASAYRNRISSDLLRMLTEKQIDESDAVRQVDDFLAGVEKEVARLRIKVQLGMIDHPTRGGSR
jgi:hypothetical protein